ncbi:nitronate monooxygenase [Methanonatronarchaeum sp. AMET-Sl]|uniref:NAD(P)H-dependent flavin oxidoreductase n=1 Tax=Methanonatronarchaeum sp. AMET-Sl TaxID=3037654 RepID=UPI00244E3AE7|nr:nitronate monooxygenase [Methanonatronarchaeum sp. AMET-Sl]WGI17980.1 nitronate monooxygenase [Methanonatronarchaeum sp. AMET-Sl]
MKNDLPSFFRTEICRMFDVKYPLIQAAMGGTKWSMAELTAEIADAGALGHVQHPVATSSRGAIEVMDKITAGEWSDDLINDLVERQHSIIDTVLKKTDGSFIVNIRVHEKQVDAPVLLEALIQRALDDEEFANQCKGILTSAGPPKYTEKIHEAGLLHLHTCALPYHAKKAVESGVDVVNVTGYEAGGHISHYPINTFPLVAGVMQMDLGVPVTAGGGVFHGSQITSLMAMGVQAVYIGTRFLVSRESDYHVNAKNLLANKKTGFEDSIVAPSLLGNARFYKTKGSEKLKKMAEKKASWGEIAREEGKRFQILDEEGNTEEAAIMAGQAIGGINEVIPVKKIIHNMMTEAKKSLEPTNP